MVEARFLMTIPANGDHSSALRSASHTGPGSSWSSSRKRVERKAEPPAHICSSCHSCGRLVPKLGVNASARSWGEDLFALTSRHAALYIFYRYFILLSALSGSAGHGEVCAVRERRTAKVSTSVKRPTLPSRFNSEYSEASGMFAGTISSDGRPNGNMGGAGRYASAIRRDATASGPVAASASDSLFPQTRSDSPDISGAAQQVTGSLFEREV